MTRGNISFPVILHNTKISGFGFDDCVIIAFFLSLALTGGKMCEVQKKRDLSVLLQYSEDGRNIRRGIQH
jgi:hypothetical protein